jgi:hypothetical protein
LKSVATRGGSSSIFVAKPLAPKADGVREVVLACGAPGCCVGISTFASSVSFLNLQSAIYNLQSFYGQR